MKTEYLRVFRAFTDENRVRVLELLCEGEQCACVLLDSLNISQPTLSHHMKILCQSGIVKSRRDGSWNYYSIDADGCDYASRLLKIIAKRKLNTTIKIMGTAFHLLCIFKLHSTEEASAVDANMRCCAK